VQEQLQKPFSQLKPVLESELTFLQPEQEQQQTQQQPAHQPPVPTLLKFWNDDEQ
jgi:hypothetical protein